MLKSLVIASGSGLVLYEKEWTKEFELVRSMLKPVNQAFLISGLKTPFSSVSGKPQTNQVTK